jgi:hypothetical protein
MAWIQTPSFFLFGFSFSLMPLTIKKERCRAKAKAKAIRTYFSLAKMCSLVWLSLSFYHSKLAIFFSIFLAKAADPDWSQRMLCPSPD